MAHGTAASIAYSEQRGPAQHFPPLKIIAKLTRRKPVDVSQIEPRPFHFDSEVTFTGGRFPHEHKSVAPIRSNSPRQPIERLFIDIDTKQSVHKYLLVVFEVPDKFIGQKFQVAADKPVSVVVRDSLRQSAMFRHDAVRF